MQRSALLLCIALFTLPLFAQKEKAIVPSPDQFLGYAIGDRFTPYDRIVDYFDELARDTGRVKVTRFGETYEHRPLVYAVITSEKNQSAIGDIQSRMNEINHAATEERAKQIAASSPAIVWLAYGVHGNESSSSEAAMLTAYALLTAPDSAKILENAIVIIDPLQNPDGRERYIHNYQQRQGRVPNPLRLALEHKEPWPGGRYNHYLIDMNRDWAWGSQQETRARVDAYQKWYPQVFVDLHEMGAESSYFFPPDARPLNLNLPSDTDKWLETFGRANSEAFTERGWPFFVGETYDLFYPAYGDSWPSFHGAIGMTFEMAGGGRAGTAYKREDDTLLTLADRANHHFIASLSTVRTAVANRESLIFHSWRAVNEIVKRGKISYVIPAGQMNIEPVVELLRRQGVEVRRLSKSAKLHGTMTTNGRSDTRDFAAGSIVIPTAQPMGGLVQSLFEKTPGFEEAFLAEQRDKSNADEPNDFYDITAWAIPLSFNLTTYAVDTAVEAESLPAATTTRSPFVPGRVGFVVDAQQPDFYLFIGRLLQNGVRFSVSETELVAKEKLHRGSLVIERGRNAANLDEAVRRAAEGTSIHITAVDSIWTEGTALGSEKIAYVRDPQIALVGGDGIDQNSFGMLWHTLDIETETPHTIVNADLLGSADLRQFRVVIIPDTGLSLLDRIGKNGVESLKAWVRSGGTIVAIRGGADALRAKEVEISKVKEWSAPKKDDDKSADEERRNDYSVPGAAFRTTMNGRSYLTFGMESAPAVLIEGSGALLPVTRKVDNIVTIADNDPLASGFAFPQSIDRVKGSAWMTYESLGSGGIITFAGEPYYRLFWRSTLPLFMNSILYSPTFNDRD